MMPPSADLDQSSAQPDAIKALLLDDSDFDRKRIRRISRRLDLPMQLVEAPSIEEMSRRLDASSFDVVLIDYRLPNGDGLAALDLIQAHAQNHSAATIMITGDAQTDIAVSAMKRGCNDYISKSDISAPLLQSSIKAALQHSNRGHSFAFDDESLHQKFAIMMEAIIGSVSFAELLRPTIEQSMRKVLGEAQTSSFQANNLETEAFIASFLQKDHFEFDASSMIKAQSAN